ncbi:signal peptidase I [Caldalkalibacillus thermarum TA2.A1]|uniref:Signal peptidase I n=1 Tax=Caldalkalibacillus thermarum (strain TA2.A1) TaxID=986075 RepID=F5L371_CALTT|nr:signal peptidase I [Caldalkalibacillus thermarum]EGL84214.1 signal peptidase I [Caldalkalibacillus thermarum TA2.A1]QZT32827.1 signal peptidase I [Caldalkalibacillus thermarum TA2.A1]
MSQSYDTFRDDHEEQNPQSDSGLSEAWEWLKAIILAVAIALIIRLLLFAPIVVDGESMLPTLHDRERLIVNKAVYLWSEPQRGDIIVFHATQDKDWIKRVIGRPGDIVEVKNGRLYINGEPVDEPYLDPSSQFVMHDFREIVPEGELFVMGDNRANSRDSRNIGTIPISSVVGRADLVFWPLQNIRLVK